MSMIPIPQETFRSAMKAEHYSGIAQVEARSLRSVPVSNPAPATSFKPWAPLGIVITSFVLWGCVYRLALVLAAAMGWL
mgnify:CR=1 FL=1